MTVTKKQLQNTFDQYRSINLELSNLDLIYSDKRFAKSVALGDYSNGVLFLKTQYYSYSEMIAFLDGFLYYKNKFLE